MSFSVTEVHELERDLCYATLRHQDQLITVMLKCGIEEAHKLSDPFSAELDHTSVVRFEADFPADESLSGLFSTDDPAVTLVDGTVHHHLKIDPDYVLIDVHVQNGPESLTVTSEELNSTIPPIDSRIRLWLLGLTVYPTHL